MAAGKSYSSGMSGLNVSRNGTFASCPETRTIAALPSAPSARTETFSGLTVCRESVTSVSLNCETPVGLPFAPISSSARTSPPSGL